MTDVPEVAGDPSSSGASPDSSGASRDSSGASRDSSGASRDSSGAHVATAKAALRTELLARRRRRGAADLVAARDRVAAAVLERAHAERWRVVAAYEPLRTEPGSVELLAGLRAAGIEVLVPITLPDRDLDWRTWSQPASPPATESGPGSAPLGRAAVAGADAVLVPALAVAAGGGRLGRGGGSYDRALARVGKGARLIALVFDDEVLGSVPAEAWDVPVHAAITPGGYRDLRNTAADRTL